MVYATTTDLADRWRPLTGEEIGPAETLLGSASRLVDSRVPDVAARITAGTLDALLVADVVCEIVRRALMMRFTQPGQTSVSVGQVQQSFSPADPQANLYITSDERARLSGKARKRAFSISTMPVS